MIALLVFSVILAAAMEDRPIRRGTWALAVSRMPFAVGANLTFAAAGWWLRAVTIDGAIAGAIIGLAVAIGVGADAWWFLFFSFGVAVLATRTGAARKRTRQIAEPRGGRRGAGNAIANTGVAAAAAIVALTTGSAAALVVLVGSIVTSVSDTVASEIGKAWGRTTWLVTTFRRVPPGTTGAVSVEGTLACAGAAALLSLVAVWLDLASPAGAAAVAAAATIASSVEGVVGVTFERSGLFDNDATNLLNSAAGGALALVIMRLL
jgi:uncharacterized protein (TIGR00297 family)